MTENPRGSSRHPRPPSARPDQRLALADPCVVVLAPAAPSGDANVSTMINTLAELGVPGPQPDGARSQVLESLNEGLLELLGGSPDRPPTLEPGWEAIPALAERVLPARAAFGLAFRGRETPVAWSDPLLPLLLPFWRAILDRPLVGLLVPGDPTHPGVSAGSHLAARPALALALYDSYSRSALAALAGLPLFVLPQGELFEDREQWLNGLVSFLRSADVKVADPAPGDPGGAGGAGEGKGLGGQAQRADETARSGSELPPGIAELAAALGAISGPHEKFEPPPLGPHDAWVEELLTARSDALVAWRGLEWAAKQLAQHPPPAMVRSFASLSAESAGDNGDGYPANATQDEPAYHRWLERHDRPVRLPGAHDTPGDFSQVRPRTTPRQDDRPLFSVIVPVYQPPIWALVRAIGSVLEQDFDSFELCLCDDGSDDEDVTRCLDAAAALDPRVRLITRPSNGGISAASNAAMGIARGEFLVFLDNDDELTSNALSAVAAALEGEPQVDVLYSDEDKVDEAGRLYGPSFKPSWSPDTLLSCAYMCHLLVVRASLVAELGGLRSELDGSQDYDLMLRATERARRVVHVPEVLYHWRTIATSAASGDSSVKPWAYEAGRRALVDAMERRGEPAEVDGDTMVLGSYRVARELRKGLKVSVIVPFRDEPSLLTQCVDSVLEAPGVDNIELCLINNGSVLPETAVLLDRLSSDPRVLMLEDPAPFNWSAINNGAAAKASGDLLLFMNNDVEATTAGWMRAMAEHAQRDEIGAVGARLLYPNRTIQHAGIVIGMGGIAAHVLQDLPEGDPGYLSWAFMTRNCLAVTGACMMTRRDVFEELGGFAEDLPIAFNDVDYCLRIAATGRYLVYTPYAELVHHESRTRGHTDDAVEYPRFLSRWRTSLERGDPYYHPSLSLWRQHCTLATPEEEKKWKNFLLHLENLR
jgi:GT2 family glycosyltransferase